MDTNRAKIWRIVRRLPRELISNMTAQDSHTSSGDGAGDTTCLFLADNLCRNAAAMYTGMPCPFRAAFMPACKKFKAVTRRSPWGQHPGHEPGDAPTAPGPDEPSEPS